MTIDNLCAALPGLDCRAAIEKMGGSTELYLKALRSTVTSMPDTFEKLDAHLAAADTRGFYVSMHGLKGVLLIIGADELAEQAQALSDASKHGEMESIKRMYPPLRRNLDDFAALVRQAIS